MLNLSRGEYQGIVRSTVSTAGLLIGLTDYSTDQSAPVLHSHENPHLSFGLRGQMAVGRKSHAGMTTRIEQFSYVRAGEEHQTFLISPAGRNINLELETQFLERYELEESQFEKLTKTPGTSFLMLTLYKELHFQDNGFSDSIDMLVLSLFQRQFLIEKNTVPRWVRIVREFLSDNWNREISLQQIGQVAEIHPVTVSKYFARYFGCSLGEYRRRLKIERALEFMKSSGKSLTEIACLCDFFDQSHFIRAFKEATGLSPKQFVK